MPGSPRRILALGDSYTIGEGVAPDERWVSQMAAALRELGVDVDAPTVIARTGWTTEELADAVERAAPRGPFDLVTLLVGVNDQYRGGAPENYRRPFAQLLARAVALAGARPARVLVLSIPDWGVTPFAAGRDSAAIARAIDAFNAVAREETRRAGAGWCDITASSRALAALPGACVADGLHPSSRVYAGWATLALGPAHAALRDQV